MNKICIVLCTYNGERFLSRFLDSLERQTTPADEIVVFDDASKDSTVSILEGYSKRLPLKIFRGEKNSGHRAAFNSALSIAQKFLEDSDLIALADQDDEWIPDKLNILKNAIGEKALVFGDAQVVDANGKEIYPSWRKFENIETEVSVQSQIAGKNNITGCLSLFRASILKFALPIPEGITVHDRWIAMTSARHGGILAVPDIVVKYRLHGSNAVGGRPCPEMSEVLKLQEAQTKAILQNAERIPLTDFEIRFAKTLLKWIRKRKVHAFVPQFLPWILRHQKNLFPNGRPSKRISRILFSCIGLPFAKKIFHKS